MEEKNNKIKKVFAETYAEDMAEVIENNQDGLVKKIIHGEEEHEEEKKNLSPDSAKNRFFILASVLLIVFAFFILAFFFFKKDNNTTTVENPFVPIIFNDQSTFLEVSGMENKEIMQTILSEVNNTKVQTGGLEGIYLTENKQKIIGLRRFISLIKSSFVPSDNTLFVKDDFLMGAILTGLKSTSPNAGDFFILLKVRSTADIFDALRAWEGKMFSDLGGFFGFTLSKETNYLFTKEFQDGIVENKNARILYDQDGNIVMMYVFADNNSVIITNSESVVHEIMLRLASAQKKQ